MLLLDCDGLLVSQRHTGVEQARMHVRFLREVCCVADAYIVLSLILKLGCDGYRKELAGYLQNVLVWCLDAPSV